MYEHSGRKFDTERKSIMLIHAADSVLFWTKTWFLTLHLSESPGVLVKADKPQQEFGIM